AVPGRRRAGLHRLVVQGATHVQGQAVGGLVAAGGGLFPPPPSHPPPAPPPPHPPPPRACAPPPRPGPRGAAPRPPRSAARGGSCSRITRSISSSPTRSSSHRENGGLPASSSYSNTPSA